jgi:hypothetical protein
VDEHQGIEPVWMRNTVADRRVSSICVSHQHEPAQFQALDYGQEVEFKVLHLEARGESACRQALAPGIVADETEAS